MTFPQPRPNVETCQRGAAAPDNDLGESVAARISRSQQIGQMGDTATGADVGGVDTKDHSILLTAVHPGADSFTQAIRASTMSVSPPGSRTARSLLSEYARRLGTDASRVLSFLLGPLSDAWV